MWQSEENAVANWYEASGTEDASYNPEGAIDVCGNLDLAGYYDWRLPTQKELQLIVNYGNFNPAVDQTFFPIFLEDTYPWPYWSSTSGALNDAWYMFFSDGHSWHVNYSSLNYVLCVRGAQLPSDDFTDNGNGTVTNSRTSLMWQKESDNVPRPLGEAIGYCESLDFAGFQDWRLPNIKELHSIVKFGNSPAIDQTFFPDTSKGSFWSSTYAWGIIFREGQLVPYDSTGEGYVRCARGGQ
jgi:hypothetical protein